MSYHVDLDDALGTLTIASWVVAYLHAAEIIQTVRYFRRYNDAYWVKGMVLFSAASSLFTVLCLYVGHYQSTVTHWGDYSDLAVQHLVGSLSIIGTTVSAIITQLYLIGRLAKLIPNLAIRTAVVALFGALAIVATAASFWTSIVLIQYPTVMDRYRVKVPTFLWFVLTAVIDVLVSVTLVLTLWIIAYRHTTKAPSGVSERTNSAIRKVMIRSLETGSLTAILAILGLVFYVHNKRSNVFVVFLHCIGRLYGLTLLASLNGRRTAAEGGSSAGGSTNKSGTYSSQLKSMPSQQVVRVQVGHGVRSMDSDTKDFYEESEEKNSRIRDHELGLPTTNPRAL